MNVFALLLALAAVVVITRDLLHPLEAPTLPQRMARALPFLLFAGLSLVDAFRTPSGRHPFRFDIQPSWDDLVGSLSKVQHLRGFAVLLLLAVVAFGARRLLVALLATMALGIATELGQATVVGHNARLSDLAPDLLGCSIAVVIVAALRRFVPARAEAHAV